MSQKATELQKLDRKIVSLKQRAKELETEMDQRVNYLQGHFRSLTLMSVLPKFLVKSGTAGTLVELLLENRQVRDSVNKFTNVMFEKLSAGIEFLGKKFGKKREQE